ncbi:MAG: sigma-70 family RNA polymerase sigma factor [Lentisphaeraceae bacterium]|nr:sigma-70 family RNA polymerase sigma factor [Lentisphaeraceae bacterium]
MTPTYSTRYTLLERAKNQSDSQAWGELIGFYRKYIYVIIHSMNINSSDYDDILQQVLVELWKYLPDYKYDADKSKFRFWVAKITRNQVISYIRKQQIHRKKLDKAQAENQLDYLNSIKTPEIEKIVTREWELFITNSAMENIQRHFSSQAIEAFKLFSKGEKVNDIAKEISVKPDSVYKYIARIKLKLVEEIGHLKKELDF